MGLDIGNVNGTENTESNDIAVCLVDDNLDRGDETGFLSEATIQDLSDLRPVCHDEIANLLKKLANKSCLLDQIPTWLVKDNSSLFIPVLTDIINVSFCTGVFPESLKAAIISPIIKKQTLDPNTLQSYRPVSNIKALAELVEMAAASHLLEHININNLPEKFYKPISLLIQPRLPFQRYFDSWRCYDKTI